MTPHRFEHECLKERVENSKAILGHPQNFHGAGADDLPVQEGVHYGVLSSTVWDGYFVATRVEWAHGEKDDFRDRMQSIDNRAVARDVVGDA